MRKNVVLLLAAAALAVPGPGRAQSASQQQKFKLKPGAVGQACLECHGNGIAPSRDRSQWRIPRKPKAEEATPTEPGGGGQP